MIYFYIFYKQINISGFKRDRELRRTSYAGETVMTEEAPGGLQFYKSGLQI